MNATLDKAETSQGACSANVDHSSSEEAQATLEISVVLPCLNEAETLNACVFKALGSLKANGLAGEVIVADNGSTDGSQDIARRAGARVIDVQMKGYGSALMGGILAARGKYVVMADADDSYDLSNLMPFVEKLREGNDLVMGNRFRGGIAKGAMPPLHRYLGNPVLTGIGKLFFRSPCSDFHCGMRGFARHSIIGLDLRTSGMEFASEMVVKATLVHLRIAEVATVLSPDGRSRPPHLRTWRDGWRHLRFLLLYSPRWLFLYPGLLLLLLGSAALLRLFFSPVSLGGVGLGIHTMLYAGMMILVGFQGLAFAAFTKIFAIHERLLPADPKMTWLLGLVNLELGLVLGMVLIAFGVGGTFLAFERWEAHAFGMLNPVEEMKIVIPSAVSFTLGMQVVLSSFFLSVLGLRRIDAR